MNEAYWLVTFRVFVGGIAVGLDFLQSFHRRATLRNVRMQGPGPSAVRICRVGVFRIRLSSRLESKGPDLLFAE